MSRALQVLNLIGTVALGVLCVFQWQANRSLNMQVNELEKSRMAQDANLAETQKNLKGTQSDLENFREQITRTRATLQETEEAFTTNRFKLDNALNENELIKASLTNWMEAVQARDGQLKTTQEQLVQLAEERNTVVARYNEVVTKHNKIARDLEQRAKDYNTLVEKYNTLAKEKK